VAWLFAFTFLLFVKGSGEVIVLAIVSWTVITIVHFFLNEEED
jgi:hypothetical protein